MYWAKEFTTLLDGDLQQVDDLNVNIPKVTFNNPTFLDRQDWANSVEGADWSEPSLLT